MLRGRTPEAALMAALTSWAAASMLRSRSNWMLMAVVPRVLVETIELTEGMEEKDFSSGVATVAAIVSGLAPGRDAVTVTVGNSTLGRLLMGSCR